MTVESAFVSSPVRIMSVGAAAGGLRLAAADAGAAWGRPGGRGQAAVCAPDEDVLTLAAEAAGRALHAAGVDPQVVDGLWWGTSRPPFGEGPSHSLLAAAIGLPANSSGVLCSGSTHAGVDALLAAADAVAAGSARLALVVAADNQLPGPGTAFEARAGAAAVALLLRAEPGPATIGARVTRTRPYLDRYRGDGEPATRDVYDARLFREEVFMPLVTEVGEQLGALDVTTWSLPDPDGRLASVVARRLGSGAPASSAVYTAVGDTGAAAALLGAAEALDAAGTVGVVAYGGGRATGVVVTVESPVPGSAAVADALSGGTPASYAQVLRARGQLLASGETVPMGVPPESAMFVRGMSEMLGLLGARCADCGTISTPPSIHPTCINCGGTKLELVPLARRGVVHTFVVNQTMPAPFVAPLPIAVVDLEDGARVMLQAIGDGSDIKIGGEVELVLRRYAHERGVPVYGFKAHPVVERSPSDS